MKPIGGFLELESRKGKSFHNGIKLNIARNCLEHLVITNDIKDIYLPFFMCEVVLAPLKKHKVNIHYYSINESLEIKGKPSFNKWTIVNNYFGIKDRYLDSFDNIPRIIFDCAQAFFYKPSIAHTSFYSARKFFGVPDGAYLYSNNPNRLPLEVDNSWNRIAHLTKRIELGAEQAYELFKDNEAILSNVPLKKMSQLTETMLGSLDYQQIQKKRNNNFNFLHSHLKGNNQLVIDTEINAPLSYPFWYAAKRGLRSYLIKNKVFIPTYWPNVLTSMKKNTLEYALADEIIHLPIDQRYTKKDMKQILTLIADFI